MKTLRIVNIIFSLILGGMLIYGGVKKLSGSNPTSDQVVTKIGKLQKKEQSNALQKILYISGMKQTGYLWQFLGTMQIICGLLLLSQVFTIFGAIMAFPIIINIFLFHLFLESNDVVELLKASGLLFINFWLLISQKNKLKSIIYQPEQLNFFNQINIK